MYRYSAQGDYIVKQTIDILEEFGVLSPKCTTQRDCPSGTICRNITPSVSLCIMPQKAGTKCRINDDCKSKRCLNTICY